MKKTTILFGLFVAVLAFAGCTLVPSTNINSVNTNSSIPATGDMWIGEWTMTSEVVQIGSNSITNPATNKTIQFEDGGAFTEDYSALEGLGVCDSTQGNYTSTWSVAGDVISVDIPGSLEVTAPYIDCGAEAGTTAVPRSLAHFSYTGDSWTITHDDATDILTATITGPPGTVTQVFERL